MVGRIVEIATDGLYLAADRGFMTINDGCDEIGRIALDDIAVLMCNAHGLTYSNNLFLKLTERKAAVVICGANHAPAAWVWPISSNYQQSGRMALQVEASRPLKKRLWQAIIKAKIRQQGAVLEAVGRSMGAFDAMSRRVRSGDSDNLEAQAARKYWPLIFGKAFRRDVQAPGINAMLNYGYAILRAGTARAIVSAGLHPSFGIFHRNKLNDFALGDDLMEPFRPIVDAMVFCLNRQDSWPNLGREEKQELARLLSIDLTSSLGTTPLSTCLERLCISLVRSFEKGKSVLELPEPLRSLKIATAAT